MLVHQRPEIVDQPRAHRRTVFQQPLFFNDLHVFDCRHRPGGAAAKGGDIAEIVHLVGRIVLEHLEHLFGGDADGNRRIARGHALGHGDEIRLDAVMLIAEPLGSGAPDPADHLVDMQQDVVFAADLLHPLPVAFGRGDDAAAGGHRLKAERAHGVGAFAQDHLFDQVGRRHAEVTPGQVAQPQLFLAVFHAMGHHHETRGEGAVLRGPLALTARRHGCKGAAVIVAVAVEDLVFLAAIFLVGDLAHHLEGLLVGLGPGIGVIDPAHPRHFVDQHLGEFSGRDRAGNGGEIIELHQLFGHRIDDPLAPIADIYGPHRAGYRVEIFLAVLVPDPHAAPLDNHPGVIFLQHLVLKQVVPDMGLVSLDDIGKIVGGGFAVHGGLLSAIGVEKTGPCHKAPVWRGKIGPVVGMIYIQNAGPGRLPGTSCAPVNGFVTILAKFSLLW